MTNLLRGTFAALVAALSTAAGAEWSGGVEGGTVVSGGESATRIRGRLDEDSRPLTHALYADWLNYGGGSGYRVGYVPRYWFDEKLYLFGEAEGRVDRPLRIERGALLLGGVGYRLHDSADAGIGVELGAGGRSTEFEALPGETEGAEESEGLAVARLSAFREVAERVRLELDLDALQGSTLGELRAEGGLAYRIAGGAVRLGVRYRRLDVDGGEAIDDTETSVGFTYGF